MCDVLWCCQVDFEVGRRALVFWSLLFYLGNAGKVRHLYNLIYVYMNI